jgi:hypothetical protein
MASNDFDGTVTSDGDSGVSRRDAIKKGAVVGGAVLWATPVIQAIGISPASATHVSPNVPHCPCLTCTANAVGLSVAGITVGGTADGTGGPACQCVVKTAAQVQAATVLVGNADAEVICARADDATCTASAYVAGLEILLATDLLLGTATYLRVSALGSCVSCGTGASYVADVRLVVETAGLVTSDTEVPLVAGSACTSGASLLGGLVVIVANEQVCGTDGRLRVNALRVTVAGISVIAGQSIAGAPGCACEPCSTAPTCTPPTARLC